VVKWIRKGGQVDARCTTTISEGLASTESLLHNAAAFGQLEMW
jgi:hypothetical protein